MFKKIVKRTSSNIRPLSLKLQKKSKKIQSTDLVFANEEGLAREVTTDDKRQSESNVYPDFENSSDHEQTSNSIELTANLDLCFEKLDVRIS